MSKITNDGLTRSGMGCFIAVPIWQQLYHSAARWRWCSCQFSQYTIWAIGSVWVFKIRDIRFSLKILAPGLGDPCQTRLPSASPWVTFLEICWIRNWRHNAWDGSATYKATVTTYTLSRLRAESTSVPATSSLQVCFRYRVLYDVHSVWVSRNVLVGLLEICTRAAFCRHMFSFFMGVRSTGRQTNWATKDDSVELWIDACGLWT